MNSGSRHISLGLGFTIVELLVVIVVIGILATITLVSYTSISQKAVLASIQSDLSSASTKLKLFQVDNMAYPNSISDCSGSGPAPGSLCITPSPGNAFSSYSANNSTNPQTYTLTATNGSIIYKVTNDSLPSVLASAPLSPVADWLATTQGDHYGNFYDLISHSYATITRTTPKTIYDPATQKIYDVPANYLAINPRSDGKSGSEAVIEESRTNYLLNSYFSNDSNSDGLGDNWAQGSPSLTTWTSSRNNSSPVYGTVQKVKAIHNNGAAATWPNLQQLSSVGAFAPGDSLTASFWYRNLSYAGAAPGINIKTWKSDMSGYIDQATTSGLIASSDGLWRKSSVTISSAGPLTSIGQFSFQQSQSVDGSYFEVEVAGAQLEKGAFATSYIPTTTATATRNPDAVTVPTTNWNANTGTVTSVIGPHSSDTTGSSPYVFSWMNTATERIHLFDSMNVGNMAIAAKSIGGDSVSGVAVMSAGTWGVVSGRWSNGGKLNIFVNGTKSSDSAVNYSTPTGLPANADIGRNSSNYAYRNASIQRIAVYPSALSDLEVVTVTNTIKDGP